MNSWAGVRNWVRFAYFEYWVYRALAWGLNAGAVRLWRAFYLMGVGGCRTNRDLRCAATFGLPPVRSCCAGVCPPLKVGLTTGCRPLACFLSDGHYTTFGPKKQVFIGRNEDLVVH